MTDYDGLLNVDDLASGVEPELGRLKALVRQHVHEAVSQKPTRELLTLTLTSGRVLTPAPKGEYVKKLVEYLRGKGDVQSATVETVALTATRAAIEEFYTSDVTIATLSTALLGQLETNTPLRNAMLEEVTAEGMWLRRELQTLLGKSAQSTVAGKVTGSATHAMSAAFNSAAGQAMGGIAAKALAMPAVKAALLKAIIVAAHNVAFQKMMMLAVKKVGVAALAHIFLAKAAAAGGGAAVPGLGWIVLGLIGGILTYDYFTLPEKLGSRLSTDLADSVGDKKNELHKTLAASFGSEALRQITHEAKKPRSN